MAWDEAFRESDNVRAVLASHANKSANLSCCRYFVKEHGRRLNSSQFKILLGLHISGFAISLPVAGVSIPGGGTLNLCKGSPFSFLGNTLPCRMQFGQR